MATSMKKMNKGSSSTVNNVVDSKVEKRKFNPDDLIECVSITPGELFMIGAKTEQVYSWADINDTVEVEFQDLSYAARRGSGMLFKPRFIVRDQDFIDLFPKLNEIYESLYTISDLKDILHMNENQIESVVKTLPAGAIESLKTIVMTDVDRGIYADIRKIKLFDRLFGTSMLTRAINAVS